MKIIVHNAIPTLKNKNRQDKVKKINILRKDNKLLRSFIITVTEFTKKTKVYGVNDRNLQLSINTIKI